MKNNFFFSLCLATSTLILLLSCIDSDKDIYDPNHEVDNPLNNLVAPSGFDWEMTSSIPTTIIVNDEYNGQYQYQVDIFDNNPADIENANLITTGFANENQNFITEIILLKSIETVFIRQTDPRGRSRVRTANVASSINCDFTSTDTSENTRSINSSTRAEYQLPDYSANSPEFINATEITPGKTLEDNTNYKITGNFSEDFNHWGGNNRKLFVSGTWTTSKSIERGIEIIILDGGKIISPTSIQCNGNVNFAIMKGGELNCTSNFTMSQNGSFYNLSSMMIGGLLKIYDGTNSIFYIGSEATIDADEINAPNGNTYIENHGTLNINRLSGGWGAEFYNACSINVKEEFDLSGWKNFTMDKGILRTPKIIMQSTNFLLKNGSMISCDEIEEIHTSSISGGSGNRSLVKVKKLGVNRYNNLTFTGNVLLEVETLVNNLSPIFANGAEQAVYNKSDITIIACTGEGNPANPGTEPQNPQFPIVIPSNSVYTFLFEDQWPIYGDYDMNDVVFRVNNIKTTINSNKKAEKFSFDISLRAVGAQKRMAGAVMFDNITASNISTITYSGATKPSSFNTANNGIEQNQSQAVIPLFDQVHAFMGKENAWYINTKKDSPDNISNPPVMTVSISFITPVDALDLNINYLNFFIITDINLKSVKNNPRREIHPIGFKPTQMAETSIFGNNNDNSSISNNRYYISRDNLPWGIVVPQDFKWPLENISIRSAYSDFEKWVISSGTENKEWWKNPDTSMVY